MIEYDYERSNQIAQTIGSVPGYCFYNAVRALRNHRQGIRKHSINLQGAKYVEGCAEIAKGFFIQHGWLELEDGMILDPTRAATVSTPVGGLGELKWKYHPAFRYSKKELVGKRLNQFPIKMIELGEFQAKLSGIISHE